MFDAGISHHRCRKLLSPHRAAEELLQRHNFSRGGGRMKGRDIIRAEG